MEDKALEKINVTELDRRALEAIKASGGAILYSDGRAVTVNSGRELSRFRVVRLLRHGMCELGGDGLFEGVSQTLVAVS